MRTIQLNIADSIGLENFGLNFMEMKQEFLIKSETLFLRILHCP